MIRPIGMARISRFSVAELDLIRIALESVAGKELPRWTTFAKYVDRVDAEPGAVLIEEGGEATDLFLVIEGYVRLTISNPDTGARRVSAVIEAGQLVGSVPGIQPEGLADSLALIPAYSFISEEVRQGGSSYGAEALTPTILAKVSFAAIERLAERHVNWSLLMIRQLYLYALLQERRQRELLTLTPEQRYLMMTEEKPDVVEVLAKKDLASMLGITPESMSRIRRRLREARFTS